MDEKPESSIPLVLEKDAYVPDDGKRVGVSDEIVFIGCFNDMLKRFGSAEQSKEKKRWQNH
ncbi:conserved hypothetical protein [Vibrio crassostreae]|nr:conserved hypothetical protein [Vibrio crassostreae]CAK2768080.1 conserved hypothetical protein [Vibrio crassostreae]CAK2769109.1 conserved hypothetical protein [Vibrio crassostreae]CAK2774547.1 conserved hypothetical protein [Vibrio crassostreae]CAK2778498.1 conserved hypothetical protein [Vibrio crassostreae]